MVQNVVAFLSRTKLHIPIYHVSIRLHLATKNALQNNSEHTVNGLIAADLVNRNRINLHMASSTFEWRPPGVACVGVGCKSLQIGVDNVMHHGRQQVSTNKC